MRETRQKMTVRGTLARYKRLRIVVDAVGMICAPIRAVLVPDADRNARFSLFNPTQMRAKDRWLGSHAR